MRSVTAATVGFRAFEVIALRSVEGVTDTSIIL
jgi:hypothetical protein